MFEQLLIVAGRSNVSKYARTKWSAAAFDALYGVRGRYGESSRERLVGVERQVAVHLAGRDVVEALDAVATRGLEQQLRPDDVRSREQSRIEDREAVVRLRGEVDDDVDLVLRERAHGEVEVGDVALDERHVVRARSRARPRT